MSSFTAALLFAALSVPGPPATAEEAIARYRQMFKTLDEIDCPTSPDPEEIVVCARRDPNPYRLPGTSAPPAGERIALLPGEPPRATASINDCLRLCPQPVGVDILSAVPAIVKGLRRILDPDS